MKIGYFTSLLFFFCISTANSQESDTSRLIVAEYLMETQEEIIEYVKDLRKFSLSKKVNKPEEAVSVVGLYLHARIGQTAITNCTYLWMTTFDCSDTNTLEFLCGAINYNIAIIEEVADNIVVRLTEISEPKILIIQANDIKQYLRVFVTKFKKLSENYTPYATACE